MGIAVLGPLTVDGSGQLSRRDRVVLETLATRTGHAVSADELVDALWGDTPPTSAGKVLQGCIVRLRKALGPDAIETTSHGYTLALPGDQLDSRRFEQMVVRARELLSLGEADRAAYQLTEALALWTGQPFADLEHWPPAVSEARRLGELRLEAQELRVDAHLRAGRHREVLAETQAMVRAAPLRERRWSLLAQAQYQAGQQGEALRTLHQLKSVLATQLGIDPGPDVAALEQAILRQDATLNAGVGLGAGITASTARCPYQGLKPYDVEDADRFFGRQDDVDACLEILRRTSLLALVGPSGSGKSSIMRAGVAAALRSRGRQTVAISPGPHPLEALTALGRAPASTVLLVDQFEEVFSLCEDSAERQEFLEALTTQAASRTIVIALRADRLADLAAHSAISRLVEQGLHIAGGLDDEGLSRAVEGPARQAGLVIEPGLVDILVREVKDDPGALPLLSYALLETWKRREGNALTVAGYRASGGIHDAISQSAERLYAQIHIEDRHLMRDLVLRLVSPGMQGEPVRSRVPRRLVATDDEHEQIIEMLIGARLVTSDDGVLEITHEALARAWPRLRGWLDDDIDGQRMLHHLSSAADAWNTLGRPDSELYRGVRLVRTLDWQGRTQSTLTETERDFLDTARRSAEAEVSSAAERERAQSRLIHRLRTVLAGAVVLLVLALAAGGVAAIQSSRANRNASAARIAEGAARQQALTAEVQHAGARAEVDHDIDQSLLVAAAAVELQDTPESLSSLISVLARNPGLIDSTSLPGSETLAIDVSPDGRRVATVNATHLVRLLDLETGRVRHTQEGAPRSESISFRALRFSPDGRLLAVGRTGLSAAPVALLDGRTLRPLTHQLGGLPPGRWQVTDLTFSSDGETVAAGLWRIGGSPGRVDAFAAVWLLDHPHTPHLVDLAGSTRISAISGYLSIALSPNGGQLYALPDRRVYDVRTGTAQPFSSVNVANDIDGLETSPDGRLIAFGKGTIDDPGGPRGAVLVDTRTGRVVHELSTDVLVGDVRFSRDGRRLLTTDRGDGVRHPQLWDVATGKLVGQLTIDGGSEQAVDLTQDGATVISAGFDHTLRTWDPTGRRGYLRRIPVHGPLPGSCWATPSSGGQYVAYLPCGISNPALSDDYVFLDVAKRRTHLVRDADPGWSLGGGSWAADGHTFLRADGGTIRRFDGRTGARLTAVHPLGDRIADVDHSPDGSRLVAAELQGRVTMLDADTLQPMGRPVDLGAPACCVSAGPDDSAFVVYGGGGPSGYWNTPADRWAIVDLDRGKMAHHGNLDVESGYWAAMSPDGRYGAVTGSDGKVEVIDLTRGEPVRPPVQAHGAGAYWAAFSPDGSRLVTTATDGSVVLWDTLTALPLARVSVSAAFSSAEFRPDGHTLLITPMTGAVYSWDPSSTRALEFACQMASRELTPAEWAETFPDQRYRHVCATP
jgi:DNA-binding SARP family transcriptional activator/WD40 repeat protein